MRGRPPRLPDAKARIMEVALDLFYHRGIRAVGISEIVEIVGVTKPTLYRFFRSKDEMVVECVAAEAERMLSAARVHLSDINDRRRLAAAIRRLVTLDTFSEEGRGLFLLNAAGEYPQADHPVREIVAAVVHGLRRRLLAVLRSGMADSAAATAAADHIILLIGGASAGCHSLGCKASLKTLEAAVDNVLQHYDFNGALALPGPPQRKAMQGAGTRSAVLSHARSNLGNEGQQT